MLLQRLFLRYCSYGKDRVPTAEYYAYDCPTAVRGFGPARRGSNVPMLQEDVARFRSRLRTEVSRGGFVFSAFASHVLEAGAPRMDGSQFAKLCREHPVLEERVLDVYLMSCGGLTAAEADIAFRQVLPKGRRSLCYNQFRSALLPRLARKKNLSLAELARDLLGFVDDETEASFDDSGTAGPFNVPLNSPLRISPSRREPITLPITP